MNYEKYRESRVDYTARMGPKFPITGFEWSMYSYERPSWLYFNGVANFLRAQGLSDAQIGERLQHKDMRWMLDSRDSEIETLGFEHARAYFGSQFSANPNPKE